MALRINVTHTPGIQGDGAECPSLGCDADTSWIIHVGIDGRFTHRTNQGSSELRNTKRYVGLHVPLPYNRYQQFKLLTIARATRLNMSWRNVAARARSSSSSRTRGSNRSSELAEHELLVRACNSDVIASHGCWEMLGR